MEEDEADVDDFAVVAVVDDGLEVVEDDPAGRVKYFTLRFHGFTPVFGIQARLIKESKSNQLHFRVKFILQLSKH